MEKILKVYSDFKGDYILIRKPLFKSGSFFKVIDSGDRIILELNKESVKGGL